MKCTFLHIIIIPDLHHWLYLQPFHHHHHYQHQQHHRQPLGIPTLDPRVDLVVRTETPCPVTSVQACSSGFTCALAAPILHDYRSSIKSSSPSIPRGHRPRPDIDTRMLAGDRHSSNKLQSSSCF